VKSRFGLEVDSEAVLKGHVTLSAQAPRHVNRDDVESMKDMHPVLLYGTCRMKSMQRGQETVLLQCLWSYVLERGGPPACFC
jgi:hypothetical protein